MVKEKWPFHQKGNKCYRIKVQNSGKIEINPERRAGGGGVGNRIVLAQRRSEWRQEGYQSHSDGILHWMMKPLPGHGSEKGSKGKLMSKRKKMKEKGEEKKEEEEMKKEIEG